MVWRRELDLGPRLAVVVLDEVEFVFRVKVEDGAVVGRADGGVDDLVVPAVARALGGVREGVVGLFGFAELGRGELDLGVRGVGPLSDLVRVHEERASAEGLAEGEVVDGAVAREEPEHLRWDIYMLI